MSILVEDGVQTSAMSDLVAKGCLVPTGKGGRSSAYEIPWAELV